ncbi:MAG: TetR/AcrR family transcriptional regulator [Proteobacteria bacterium]|nr:TetR/AcrR family transcriptional regulator [Pseudomonadota bacterium]
MSDKRDAAFEEKRRAILRAATKVFAQKGYTGTRVGDIAKEAGIAYGLIYHYFANKEDILNSLFQGTWSLTLKVLEGIHEEGGTLRTKLRKIAGFFLEAWSLQPDVVEVVVLEVIRSPKFLEAANLEAFQKTFMLLEKVIASHQDQLREGTDPRMAAVLFLGSLEILLTGFVAREFLSEGLNTESGADAVVDTFLYGIVGS